MCTYNLLIIEYVGNDSPKNNKNFIFLVCVCSIYYEACDVHEPYYDECVLYVYIHFFTLPRLRHDFRKKVFEICFFYFHYKFCLSLNQARDCNEAHKSLYKVPVTLVTFQLNFNFLNAV